MMSRPYLTILLACLCNISAWASTPEELAAQVRAIEQEFAQSMADRDFEAFKAFLADEAIFISGDRPARGKQAVAELWAGLFEGEEAPFSWQPETVVVLDSGTLALSSGPVFDASGQRTSTFSSTWRREDGGQWRIVFDKGNRYCPPPEN
jgi:ketosteroid isomerase-like protein